MAVIRCKMCGGTLAYEPGAVVCECEYCGSRQTLPNADSEKKANLFNRANRLRMNNEFDKASAVYESIAAEFPEEAEAYWGLCLCTYGIEYVDDPATGTKKPTCHRTMTSSIMEDENFEQACDNADAIARRVYREEAKAIDRIQKDILSIAANETPYDVFICYKETDEAGNRTEDSVLAQDIYDALTAKNLKVFFSRITLEDKLGVQYEPYIYAALSSAKVMVAFGTQFEYFDAVWVKNEWSRFLGMMKTDKSKTLIPCFKGIDAYDMPKEFKGLQAQDMAKLGWLQDLVRGVEKLCGKSGTVQNTVVVQQAPPATGSNSEPLLKRAFLFLEDGDWKNADEYCEKVLDMDPENAQAYLGKLMAELQVRRQADLKNYPSDFSSKNNYQKILRFGDNTLKEKLKADLAAINERNETQRKTEIYNTACKAMSKASTEAIYEEIAEKFQSISGFKDADAMAAKCREKADAVRKDAVYTAARAKMNATATITDYEKAIEIFQTISGWKDANEQIAACERKIEEIKAKEEAARKEAERLAQEKRIAAEKAAKKRKKIIALTVPIVCACIAFIIVLTQVIIPNKNYNAAVALMDAGQYEEAIAAFEALNGYKDSAEKAVDIYVTYQQTKFNAAEVGDYVYFGSYEQDNNTSNGKEDIEWFVLDKKDNQLLIISRYGLDAQPYNTVYEDVTWETCTLREWLNSTFLNSAFGATEQTMIQSTEVTADSNPYCSTSPGNDTTDKIFLLSIAEANEYFASDYDRMCIPTAYAKSKKAYTSASIMIDGEETCQWWLRSSGCNQKYMARIRFDGSLDFNGELCYNGDGCVRPAMWIDLDF